MHCASIVLNIAADKAADFERGFREHELPTHRDLYERGLLRQAPRNEEEEGHGASSSAIDSKRRP